MLVILCGGLFLLAGLLRLGFVAQFLSRPVMESFVFGLAIFVTVKQLPKLFGIEKGDGEHDQPGRARGRPPGRHERGDAGGRGGRAGAAVRRRELAPRVPGGLLALVLGIVVSAALGLSSHGVEVVGEVPSGLPTPGVPSVDGADLVPLLAAAGGMVLVIFSESLGAANTFALEHGYEIDANQELIALGVANVGSGLVGGLGGWRQPVAVGGQRGSRRAPGDVHDRRAVLIVVTVLVLTPLFKDLPEAVLAALIIHAVSHLWKFAAMRRVYAERRVEFALGLARRSAC